MNHDIYSEIARLIAAGQEAAVATVVAASGSSPREAGAKMLVRSDGSILGTVGGGNIEKDVIQQALAVMRQGKAQKIEYRLKPGDELGMICGGDVEVFIEPVITAPRLYIFGAGHIAVPLTQMAALVGFNITVIDDREGFATAERFPASAKNITSSFATAFDNLDIDQGAFLVIVTHGHKGDEDVLAAALKTPARYIGMIGSKEKNAAVYSHLLERGYTQQDFERVHAPIGARIKAQTPAEIAVSILAELILVKSNR
jgi:xanthine dehydrogenase accessory factor